MSAKTRAAGSGRIRAAMLGVTRGRRAKATTNVRRYTASGSTDSNGKDATSVEMYVVTPSIRLEAMSAVPTHRARVLQARDGTVARAEADRAGGPPRRATST